MARRALMLRSYPWPQRCSVRAARRKSRTAAGSARNAARRRASLAPPAATSTRPARASARNAAPSSARRRPPRRQPSPPAPPRRAPASAAERRQLTVMFCDLVGSTALSTRLDPEDLREVIAAYHKCAADVVGALPRLRRQIYGRRRARLFRLPGGARGRRRERGARRAGDDRGGRRASRSATARHQVRIGIATGLVVVGELVGSGEAQERNVVGETPNLAARLQSAAAPNSVLIAASTRRLTGDLFEYEPVDPGALKGFDGPVARLARAARAEHAEPLRGAARGQPGAAGRPRGGTRSAAAPLAAGQGKARAASCCCPASPASASRG